MPAVRAIEYLVKLKDEHWDALDKEDPLDILPPRSMCEHVALMTGKIGAAAEKSCNQFDPELAQPSVPKSTWKDVLNHRATYYWIALVLLAAQFVLQVVMYSSNSKKSEGVKGMDTFILICSCMLFVLSLACGVLLIFYQHVNRGVTAYTHHTVGFVYAMLCSSNAMITFMEALFSLHPPDFLVPALLFLSCAAVMHAMLITKTAASRVRPDMVYCVRVSACIMPAWTKVSAHECQSLLESAVSLKTEQKISVRGHS